MEGKDCKKQHATSRGDWVNSRAGPGAGPGTAAVKQDRPCKDSVVEEERTYMYLHVHDSE